MLLCLYYIGNQQTYFVRCMWDILKAYHQILATSLVLQNQKQKDEIKSVKTDEKKLYKL